MRRRTRFNEGSWSGRADPSSYVHIMNSMTALAELAYIGLPDNLRLDWIEVSSHDPSKPARLGAPVKTLIKDSAEELERIATESQDEPLLWLSRNIVSFISAPNFKSEVGWSEVKEMILDFVGYQAHPTTYRPKHFPGNYPRR